jgi:hypothetical protein
MSVTRAGSDSLPFSCADTPFVAAVFAWMLFFALRETERPCTAEADAMAKIPRPKDFYAGLLFVAFGVVAIIIARNYPLGTAARMGPGYFPRLLGFC